MQVKYRIWYSAEGEFSCNICFLDFYTASISAIPSAQTTYPRQRNAWPRSAASRHVSPRAFSSSAQVRNLSTCVGTIAFPSLMSVIFRARSSPDTRASFCRRGFFQVVEIVTFGRLCNWIIENQLISLLHWIDNRSFWKISQ